MSVATIIAHHTTTTITAAILIGLTEAKLTANFDLIANNDVQKQKIL